MSESTSEQYDTYIVKNYNPPPCCLVKGEGLYAWDDKGKQYLDFGTGIAVNALGHCHPKWVKRIQEQTATLVHTSNIFANENQGKLAEKLVDIAGPGRVYFCNSGAEADEALIKLSRLHGVRESGEEGKKYHIITANDCFHGRTFGGMSATPQTKIRQGFAPLVDGFKFADFNDLASFEAQIDENTIAIFIETVQGESGIYPASKAFLQGIRALCDKHNLLLMLDEVQCGAGRTGKFFAYEHSGIRPDAIAMAKGIGGGYPLGAIWIDEKYADLFTVGSHGSTFGGSPLACAAGLAVIEVMEEENILENVTKNADIFIAYLNQFKQKFPDLVVEARGAGYMIGIELSIPPRPILADLRDAGLIAVAAGHNVLRLLPPLTATQDDLRKAADIIEGVFKKMAIGATA